MTSLFWRPPGAPKLLVGAVLALLSGCAQFDVQSRTTMALGTSSPEFLSQTLDAEEDALLGVSQPSSGSGLSSFRPSYKLSASYGVSLRRAYKARVSDRLAVSASLAGEIGKLGYHLPDGVLLANGVTRLTDPIDLTFQYVGLRPELEVSSDVRLGRLDAEVGIGVGYAVQNVTIRAQSALLDFSRQRLSKTPYVFLSSKVPFANETTGIEFYYRQSEQETGNLSAAFTHSF